MKLLHTAKNGYIETIWQGLEKDLGRRRNVRYDVEIARDGWAPAYLIEDALWGAVPWEVIRPATNLIELAGAPSRTVYYRPRAKEKFAYGSEEILAADYADILILLERLGFSINADRICQLLRPAILKKHKITGSELRVLWYEKERGRMAPVMISGEACEAFPTKNLTTATGYRASFFHGASGVMCLTVTKPRRKRAQ